MRIYMYDFSNELIVVSTLLQLILLNRYCSVLFHVSNKNKYVIITCYILVGGIICTSAISHSPDIVTVIIISGSVLLITLLYQTRFKSKLIYSMFFLVMAFISESLSEFFSSELQAISKAVILSKLENQLLILLFSTFMMILFILFIKFIKRGHEYKISTLYFLVMTLIILFSLFLLITLFFYSTKNIFFFLSIIGILVINIIPTFLFNSLNEHYKLKGEHLQLQRQMDCHNNNYVKTALSFKSIKRIIHDTNKQLLYIRTCIQENLSEEAVRHINQSLDQINVPYISVSTGNLAIDSLVSNAINIANENHIAMKCKINIVTVEFKIERYDLCILIGNILDNALEAVRQVPLVEDKYIHLQVYSNKNTLVIHVINSRWESSEQDLHILKENKDLHGYGLMNIQTVAEKYGGHVTTESNSKQFEIIVVLPFLE